MSRPRLLLAVHTYPDGGGISAIVENYVTELRERYEAHVAIVEARPGWKRLREYGAEPHVIGYSNLINPLLFPTSLLHSLRVGWALRQLVTEIGPAALITQDALHLAVPAQMAVLGRPTPLALMDHGTLTNVYESEWLPMLRDRLGGIRGTAFAAGFHADRFYREIRWRSGVRRADRLWYTGTELEPYFGSAGARAQRYSQSVPRDFQPATEDERRAARGELAIAGGTRVVNSVGRLDGEKGLNTLIEALDCEQLRTHDFVVLIAGDGSLEEWLRREVTQRSLDDRVRFLGRLTRSEVAKLHHASDLHLYAGTVSCGVSICLLEAMASGVVPIASDVPTAQRELIGAAGWVFRAGSVEELRGCLHEAVELTDDAIRSLGVAAVQAVHRQSDPAIPQLIDELVNNGPAHLATRLPTPR